MTRKIFLITVVLSVWIIQFACKENDTKAPITTVRFNNIEDTVQHDDIKFPDDGVERDVPGIFKDYVLYKERHKVYSALKIGSIENGYDSLQIRIDGNEYKELSNGWSRLLVFYNNGNWNADAYYIRFAGEDGFILIIDSLQYQKYSLGVPRSGWLGFIDTLKQLGLFTLPDYHDVPGYAKSHTSTHATFYNVEIATEKSYRIFSYLGPATRTKQFKEAEKFMKIMSFIKNEFIFPEPWTPDHETD
ncbi:MAG TPA: hypothetical protein VFZ33_03555 [Chitinophagaceae bacterium]